VSFLFLLFFISAFVKILIFLALSGKENTNQKISDNNNNNNISESMVNCFIFLFLSIPSFLFVKLLIFLDSVRKRIIEICYEFIVLSGDNILILIS
jgi:hypothetical protein